MKKVTITLAEIEACNLYYKGSPQISKLFNPSNTREHIDIACEHIITLAEKIKSQRAVIAMNGSDV